MKKLLFIAAACMLAVACTPQDGGGETASLEVSPKSLTFGAEDTTPQEITVTATGVEWEYAVPSSADWITVDDGTAGKLLVSVAKNPTAEKRTASIRITAKDNDDLEPVSVTVTQAGSETPEVYSLTVDPAALTFEAEGAAGQSVKVTASGEGMTWSAAVEDAAKEWITLSATEGAEGETTLTVTVQDNPDTAERSANVTLTPSAESVGPKAIRVTQEAKVLPPSLTMTYNDGDVPEEGFVIDYLGRKRYTINVVPVNLDWNVRVSYDNEKEKDWLTVNPFKDEDSGIHNISINANDKKNENSAPRTARVIVTTDVEGIGPFEIPVTQEGKPEFLSTLEEDVDFGVLTQSRIAVYPNDELRHQPYTLWELKLWDEGITLTSSQMFIGTGNRLHMKLYTDPIEKNDDNIYILPEGTYTVTTADIEDSAYQFVSRDIMCGRAGFSHPKFPSGTWYIRMENDTVTGDACITGGTITVTRNGEEYDIAFDFTSDAGYKVTGSFKGILDLHVQ